MKFFLVVAIDEDNGIGIDGQLPWYLSEDLKFFAKVTKTTEDPDKQNAVIMGRKTWESIPDKYRPLPGRLNIVLSRSHTYFLPSDVLLESSFGDALKSATEGNVEKVFVIGGGRVFEETLNHPGCGGLYVTEVLKKFNCDTFFPEIDSERFERVSESEILEEDDVQFRFVEYRRK
ncbi:MAG: dihydrofolate reductase [Candidatus Peregrinibacteria bacterium]|nr:dihydrofolate reductase [Candidatus Peregrinibacteria bacterium]